MTTSAFSIPEFVDGADFFHPAAEQTSDVAGRTRILQANPPLFLD
ncbi:hypothetical protein [Microbacterium sp.]|nr:hypothetical protein [Microbacterium sp.]